MFHNLRRQSCHSPLRRLNGLAGKTVEQTVETTNLVINEITGSKERRGLYKIYFSFMMCIISVSYIVDLTFSLVERFRIMVHCAIILFSIY